jgi:regulator of protease activity HflC (stomatin/prohibitin superfamily)
MSVDVTLVALLAVVAILAVALAGVRILPIHQRAVVFQLGRFKDVRGPGLVFIVPVLQEMKRVDLRPAVIELPPQEFTSSDGEAANASAKFSFQVLDPEKALTDVADYRQAASQFARVTVKTVLGMHPLDEILSERERIGSEALAAMEAQMARWGLHVDKVEIARVAPARDAFPRGMLT